MPDLSISLSWSDLEGDIDAQVSYLADHPRITLDEAKQAAFDQAAQIIFDDYRDGWPVDTGDSQLSLVLEVEDLDATISSYLDYAYWVERRWYPFPADVDIAGIAHQVNAR